MPKKISRKVPYRFVTRLILQSAYLVRWFLTNRKMNEQNINLIFVVSLAERNFLVSPTLPRQKKVRAEKSRIKTRLVTIFDIQNIIHKEFLPERRTMNSASNARPHPANIVKQFQAKRGREQMEHPPYLPDLNHPDFFLFPRLKLALKGKRFDKIPNTQRNVTRRLNSIPK
ncbi:histone-lysine N-methyltransferase SETMAR [Trichonephila clavipes]|nr:histone-lysine N-methyltransferase SETMAR [Trichonephila clavipes]